MMLCLNIGLCTLVIDWTENQKDPNINFSNSLFTFLGKVKRKMSFAGDWFVYMCTYIQSIIFIYTWKTLFTIQCSSREPCAKKKYIYHIYIFLFKHIFQLSWPSEQTQGQPIIIEDSPLHLISISHFPCSENANQNSWPIIPLGERDQLSWLFLRLF
jgi:hypothetical protein